jgi:hypothetical protein
MICLCCALSTAHAEDEDAEKAPYNVYWSFPRDDMSAIEVDDPDVHASEFPSKWALVNALSKCDVRRSAKLLKKRAEGEGTPVRELRIDSLDGDGKVHSTTRCVLPLSVWRIRMGQRLTERLEDELDAHVSFLVPRKHPPLPNIPQPPAAGAQKP